MLDRPSITLSRAAFKPASSANVARGLLGWVSCEVGGTLKLDGLALRRTQGGRLCISFPSRRDRGGIEHPIIAPVDDAARHQLEQQILEALEARS